MHVNRVLREFRDQRLIAVQHRVLSMLDVDGLQDIAGFNKEYLHLGGASDEMARYFDQIEARQIYDKGRMAAGQRPEPARQQHTLPGHK